VSAKSGVNATAKKMISDFKNVRFINARL